MEMVVVVELLVVPACGECHGDVLLMEIAVVESIFGCYGRKAVCLSGVKRGEYGK